MVIKQNFNTSGVQTIQQQMIAIPQMLIMHYTEVMINADIEKDYEVYYKAFKHVYGLLSSYIPLEDRKGIQEDWNILLQALDLIEKASIADQSKEIAYTKLWRSFVEAHRFYLMKAYSKALYVVSDDAKLPIDILEFDVVANIIRSGFGNIKEEVLKDDGTTNTTSKPE